MTRERLDFARRFWMHVSVMVGLIGSLHGAGAAPEPVWVDVDCSAGIFTKDVDDALALVQAFRSPELDIRGVSVVYGNASLEACLPITRELTDAYGPAGMEVLEGAKGPESLGQGTPAHEGLVQALESGPLTLLALGPLTTVGTLLQLRPDLAPRVRRIVMVAGRRPGQQFRTGTRDRAPLSDFNFERDPEAMQVVLDSEIELVLVPWEVSSQVWIREADLDRLDSSGGSGAWIAAKSRPWLLLWQRVFHADGFNPFDTLAVGFLTHPEVFESFEGRALIEMDVDDVAKDRFPDGEVGEKPFLYVGPEGVPGRKVTYVHTVGIEPFRALLLERISGDGSEATNFREISPPLP